MVIQSLESLDAQLKQLEEDTRQIIDPAEIQRQLGIKTYIDVKELGHLEAQERKINEELDCLQELWYIFTLVKEIGVNTELFEFETVFASINKLTIRAQRVQEESIRAKILQEVAHLEDAALAKVIGCWRQLFVVQDDAITFNEEVEIDGFSVSYESITTTVEQHSLINSEFNASSLIFSKLVQPLFQSTHCLTLKKNTITSLEVPEQTSILATLSRHIESTKALVDFVNLIPNKSKIISYISPKLFESLKALITEYAKEINESEDLQQKFKELGDYINDLNFRRSDLKQWISTELCILVTEHTLNSHIEKVRFSFKDKKNFEHIKHSWKPKRASTQESLPQQPTPQQKSKAADEDGWGDWGNDDPDIDIYDNCGNDNIDPANLDDEWGWDDDEENEKLQSKPKPQGKKLVSKLNKRSKSPTPSTTQTIDAKLNEEEQLIMISHFPKILKEIVETYEEAGRTLPNQYYENHMSKIDYLLTSFFAIAIVRYQEKLLLFNDITFLNTLRPVPTLIELGDRMLWELVHAYQNEISLNFSKLNDLDPRLSTSETFRIIEIIQSALTTLFEKLDILAAEIKTTLVLSVMDEFYQLIIHAIELKPDIGEQESEYLSRLIYEFLNLKQPLGSKINQYSKNYQKLSQFDFILQNHLKEIMDKFYDGGFFELSTEEIVSMLDKLFADSDLKKQHIREIMEIREEL
jgi:predicted transport protein